MTIRHFDIISKFRSLRWTTLLSCMALLLAAASCSSADDGLVLPDEPDVPVGPDGMTTLVIRSGAMDGARAGKSDADREIMHSLRVVILRPDGSVEINHFRRFDTPQESSFYIYKVKPGENKRIYLIANEESVSPYPTASATPFREELDGFTAGTKGIDAVLENKVYGMDLSTPAPLPMTGYYEIGLSELKPNRQIEKTLYVVRTVCKFSVTFSNKRSLPVTFDKFTISQVAKDAGYLMPHFNSSKSIWKIDESVVSVTAGKRQELPADWIGWLREAAEESQRDPNNEKLADQRGWIFGYDVPTQAAYHSQDLLNGTSFQLKANSTHEFPTFYCFESDRIKPGQSTFAPGLEQEYRFHLKFKEKGLNGQPVEYDEAIPNLRALFRNTHAVINISVVSTGLTMEVNVVPYAEKVLEPNFGLD